MMERLLTLTLMVLLLNACAQPPGFRISDYTFTRVSAEHANSLDKTQVKPTNLASGFSVIRASNKIDFKPTASKWDKDNVQFKANVSVAGKSFGEVEFKGTRKDSKILLTPVNQELSNNLKAQVVCTSDDETCNDFFIDVLYKDDQVIYQDQIIPKPKVEPAPKAEKSSAAKGKDIPKVESKEPEPGSKTPSSPNTSKSHNPPSPTNLFSDAEIISDGLEGADLENSSYVGISDDEIRHIFQIEQPKESQTKPSPTPAPKSSPASAPVQTPQKDVKDGSVSKGNPKGNESKSEQNSKSDNTSSKDDLSPEFEAMRAKDQVVGLPTHGWLKNGTDFLKLSGLSGFHFFIANPNSGVKDYFGAFDMAVLMKKLGDALQVMMPGRRLAVTAISKWGGGRLEPHEGHQNGTDIDIRYLTNDETAQSRVITRGRANSSLLVNNQWQILKKAFETNMVDVVFVDPAIKRAMCEEARRVQDYKNGETDSEGAEVLKRIQTWPGHSTHFHIRIRCSSDNPRCKRVPIVFNKVGC